MTATHIDYNHREGESTLAYCGRLPKRRWSHEAKGRVLFLPRTGMTVVPHTMHADVSWTVVVVSPGPDPACQRSYAVGGYDLIICEPEIETAIEVDDISYIPTVDPEWLALDEAHPAATGQLV